MLAEANLGPVIRICRRVDGMPLGIELAASRVKSIGLDVLAALLDDEFAVLRNSNRETPARQQTMRSLIEWSYGLLTVGERTLLHRLAIFSGGCSLSAADFVCGFDPIDGSTVMETLSSLVEKSQVVVEQGRLQIRYRLLQSIHEFALEKLRACGDYERVANQSHRFDHATLIILGMNSYWYDSGLSGDGLRFIEDTLAAAPNLDARLLAQLLLSRSALSVGEVRFESLARARTLFESLGDRVGLARTASTLAIALCQMGDHEGSAAAAEESIAHFHSSGAAAVLYAVIYVAFAVPALVRTTLGVWLTPIAPAAVLTVLPIGAAFVAAFSIAVSIKHERLRR